MAIVKNIYLRLYFFVMLLYVFFNKGVAYSFLVEVLFAGGLFLFFFLRREIEITWNKRTKILLAFILLSILYLLIGSLNYPLIQIIRDSFVFQYAWFVYILFSFKEEQGYIWDKLFIIYKWFPVIALLNFILQYFVPFVASTAIFGSIPIMLYKNGDMGVHLLISTIFLFLFPDRYSSKWKAGLLFLIVFNFIVVSAYSRSGMLSYLVGLICFFVFTKDQILKSNSKYFLKYLPWIMLVIVPLFLTINVGENFQGRSAGFSQLGQNVGSIVGAADDANLENNEIWRLLWWGKIIDYSFTPEYFFTGKGLGMSLAQTDEIKADDDLRSPHNFHLTIMARFGVIVFCIWIYWLVLLFKPMFKRKLVGKQMAISCILLAFVINASFDVFLEGPMGAFPFWTFIGLLFISEATKEDQSLPPTNN
jgi:hypothetical protein